VRNGRISRTGNVPRGQLQERNQFLRASPVFLATVVAVIFRLFGNDSSGATSTIPDQSGAAGRSAVGANSSVVGRLSRVNLLADYFKTIEGKECENVTVWRVGHPTASSVAQASAADVTSELSIAAALPDPLNPKREYRLSSPQLN